MMRKINSLFLLMLVSLLLILGACDSDNGSTLENNETGNDPINVVTTIAQIGEPLSVIGGDRLNVESLMGPSVDPHLYSPTQSDMSKIADAELIFYNGLDLEANMIEVFDSIGRSIPVLAIGETVDESDILDDEAGARDPHIWFDVDLWQEALDAAVEELKDYDPEYADIYEENKQSYFQKLDELKEEAAKLADIPESQRILVTAHDAFGYFGRMHDIDVIGLQGISTDSEVGLSDINETIEIISEYEVPAIFVESSINPNTIEAVLEGARNDGVDVELGGELYSDAMGEAGTVEGTYIGMYRHNIDTIYQALTNGGE